MYELYRDNLSEHFHRMNDDPDLNVNVSFKDTTEKSGMVVESIIKVHQRTQNGCGRPKYTVNLYHTNNSMMVNGKHAMLFNSEHIKITDLILASGSVSQLDKVISSKILEGLREITVNKSNKQSNTVNSAETSQVGGNLGGGACIQRDSVTTVETGKTDSEEESMCLTCKLPIGDGASICCDRCDVWTHIECDQINPDMHKLLTDNIDMGYTCLACTHELQCEDLNESLSMETRNMQESNPLDNSEETYKKIGYEPETNPPNAGELTQATSVHVGGPPGATQLAMHTPTAILGRGTDERSSNTVVVDPEPQVNEQRVKKKGLNTITGASKVDCDMNSNMEGKSSKQNRKGGRNKFKETEQEEQLKLQRAVINNLERKLGEVENSNKILRQEVNLLKSGRECPPVLGMNQRDQSDSSDNGAYQSNQQYNYSNQKPCQLHVHETVEQTRHSDISQMREQLRTMEYELLKNRITNIEASLHQQRLVQMQLSSMQPVPNVYGNVIQGSGMFPHQAYAGAQSPTYYMYPLGYPVMHNMQVNPAGLQGYPINYVEQARAQQYNLPRMNLQFRSEQMSQNPFQGYPVGAVRQVHTSSEQVQSRQSSHRANLGFRGGNRVSNNNMQTRSVPEDHIDGPRQRNSPATTYTDKMERNQQLTQVLVADEPTSPICSENSDSNETSNSATRDESVVYIQDGNTPSREPTVVVDVEEKEKPPRDTQDFNVTSADSTPTQKRQDTPRQSFLGSGRASEKTWKRNSY